MHRSGTSSLAGALVCLGGAAPRTLMTAAPDNVRGFWESTAVMALNDEILAAGGSAWDDWRQFDLRRIGANEAQAYRERARALLAEEFGDAPLPIVKDPRMCRLMPLWRPAFEEVGWSARAILTVRSPLEVAWSLRRRDGREVGLSCLTWLRHMLDAERDTRGMRRVVIDWARFLQDSRALLGPVAERLEVAWPRGAEGFGEVERFLSPDLRRFAADPADLDADPAVTGLVGEVHAAMLALTDDPDAPASLRRLDALRVRFDAAAAVFEPAMSAYRRADEIASARERAMAARLAEAEKRASDLSDALARANALSDALGRANAVINRHVARPPSKLRDLIAAIGARVRKGKVDRSALAAIRRSPFFDAAFYLDACPDVRAPGVDPALHYLMIGWREGRDPGPFFSTRGYRARNPDVAEADVNPLVHYETCGRKEGRPAIF